MKEWRYLGWLLPWLVLVAALAIAYLAWQSERQNAMEDLRIDFGFRVRETHSRIEERMAAYEQILRGARALFMASGRVASKEFRDYTGSLHLEDTYPGSMGIGFSAIAATVGDHAAVNYFTGFPGDHPPVISDSLYSDPVFRTAMDLARDTGKVVNSGKVLLPLSADEDKRIQGGFLMFLPVYRNGASLETVAERRANIIGWVYMPFRMVDLMAGILDEIATEIDIEIHDGEDVTDASMMYDPDVSGAGGNPLALFRNAGQIRFDEHLWTVVIVSLPGFEMRMDSSKPDYVAYVGIQISVLLTLLAWLLVRDRARAVYAAEEINRELTERKRAEEGLRLAATVVKTVEEAVLVTDRSNLIIAVNPAFTAITGYAPKEVLGKNPRILSSGKHPKEFFGELWETLLSTDSWHGEIWDRRKNGEIYIKWLSIRLVRDTTGEITHHVGVFSDISERKAAEERMQHMAHHDALTNLPNRALFADRLQRSITQARREKEHLALMFIDLDKFKPVNDTYGHATGDQLLKEVAMRLQSCVRESDTVSRIGGDEFVVLLPAISSQRDALPVAEKMLQALEPPFELAGHSLHISASIGIAVYPEHGSDEKTLANSADIAMYYAKSGGCNCAKLYRPDMQGAGR